MYGTRRFMDAAPMMGHGQFVSLGQQAPVVIQAPYPAQAFVLEERPSMLSQVGTLAAIAGVGFLALELTGVTNVFHLSRLMK